MDKGSQDHKLKCKSHGRNISLYCDNDTCKLMLCSQCLVDNDHDDHRFYGLGALKDTPINGVIIGRRDELTGIAEKLKVTVNELKTQKVLCDTYQDEIEKINATEIGKTLLAHMGQNKETLIDVCNDITKSLSTYLDRTQLFLTNVEAISKQLNLNLLIEKTKTIKEDKLKEELKEISGSVMQEGREILKSIEGQKIGEKLKKFKSQLGQPLSLAGKRSAVEKKQAEAAPEASISSEEDKEDKEEKEVKEVKEVKVEKEVKEEIVKAKKKGKKLFSDEREEEKKSEKKAESEHLINEKTPKVSPIHTPMMKTPIIPMKMMSQKPKEEEAKKKPQNKRQKKASSKAEEAGKTEKVE